MRITRRENTFIFNRNEIATTQLRVLQKHRDENQLAGFNSIATQGNAETK